MNEFLSVLSIVFLGEIGDKTMLVCLFLTTIFSVRSVLIGVIPACVVVPLIGIATGVAFKTWLPEWSVRLGGSALFLYLCYWSIREAREGDEVEREQPRFGPVVESFVVFFIAEMADRTQFITIAATTQGGDWVADWLGSAAGLILANLAAVGLFKFFGKNIPRRHVMYAAAVLFLASGVWLGLDVLGLQPVIPVAAICLAGLNPWAYRIAAKHLCFAA